LADNYQISIDQGATYSLALTYKDSNGTAINLTGYTAAMQIRTSYESSSTVVSLTSSSGIVITAATGLLTINITSNQTAALTPGTYVYDLEITSGAGVVTRLIQGSVMVSAEVTR
jgi:hypothetical protein